jgi:hypothetical protein
MSLSVACRDEDVHGAQALTWGYMTDLLQAAVDAHGGLERWNQLKTVKASLSITGAIWQLKRKPDVLKDVSIEAELHKERLTTHFNGQGLCTGFRAESNHGPHRKRSPRG